MLNWKASTKIGRSPDWSPRKRRNWATFSWAKTMWWALRSRNWATFSWDLRSRNWATFSWARQSDGLLEVEIEPHSHEQDNLMSFFRSRNSANFSWMSMTMWWAFKSRNWATFSWTRQSHELLEVEYWATFSWTRQSHELLEVEIELHHHEEDDLMSSYK
jgi:hypothetical protein